MPKVSRKRVKRSCEPWFMDRMMRRTGVMLYRLTVIRPFPPPAIAALTGCTLIPAVTWSLLTQRFVLFVVAKAAILKERA